MNSACARADIVISDRRLPSSCRPRGLKIDRTLLAGSGGLAIDLDRGTIDSVAAGTGRHPWSAFRESVAPAKAGTGTARGLRPGQEPAAVPASAGATR